MTLPGETIFTGASDTCRDCGIRVELKVCQSNAGFYVGTMCACGPYSRETDYFRTFEEAERELEVLTVTGDCESLRRAAEEYRPLSIRRDH